MSSNLGLYTLLHGGINVYVLDVRHVTKHCYGCPTQGLQSACMMQLIPWFNKKQIRNRPFDDLPLQDWRPRNESERRLCGRGTRSSTCLGPGPDADGRHTWVQRRRCWFRRRLARRRCWLLTFCVDAEEPRCQRDPRLLVRRSHAHALMMTPASPSQCTGWCRFGVAACAGAVPHNQIAREVSLQHCHLRRRWVRFVRRPHRLRGAVAASVAAAASSCCSKDVGFNQQLWRLSYTFTRLAHKKYEARKDSREQKRWDGLACVCGAQGRAQV